MCGMQQRKKKVCSLAIRAPVDYSSQTQGSSRHLPINIITIAVTSCRLAFSFFFWGGGAFASETAKLNPFVVASTGFKSTTAQTVRAKRDDRHLSKGRAVQLRRRDPGRAAEPQM